MVLKPDYRKLLVFYLVVAFAITILLFCFDSAIGNELTLYARMGLYLGEGLLLAVPLWILPRRWRMFVPIMLCLSAVFLWVNVVYFRYWGDLLTWSLIGDAANYNEFVFRALPGLMRWTDLIYWLIPVAVFILYVRMGISGLMSPPVGVRVLVLIGAIVLYCLGFSLSVISSLRYYSHKGETSTFLDIVRHRFSTLSNSRMYEWHGNGILIYSYIQLSRDNGRIDRLDDDQYGSVVEYLMKNGELNRYRDSVPTDNSDKNLILIIVESLNSWAVGETVNGHTLTPTLDSILVADGTVACLNVVPQRLHGGSSDGHLMYNTGLLPISYGSAAMLFAGNDFTQVSLASHFEDSRDFIVEDGSVWNHRATTAAYGYDRLVERIDVGSTPIDRTLFDVAADTLETLRQPFWAEIITLGMHYPFVDANMEVPLWLENDNTEDVHLRNYHKVLYGFDAALASFIDKLKQSGLYDRSIILIASDHDLDVGERRSDGRIVFIALNTGHSGRIDRTVGQIDIYPTIIDIMGFDDCWKGLGMSVFDSRNNSAVLPDGTVVGHSDKHIDSLKQNAWRVSDLLIRSDWFRYHPLMKADTIRQFPVMVNDDIDAGTRAE